MLVGEGRLLGRAARSPSLSWKSAEGTPSLVCGERWAVRAEDPRAHACACVCVCVSVCVPVSAYVWVPACTGVCDVSGLTLIC